MHTKIKDFVKSFINCQRAKTTRHIISPVTSIPMPNKCFESINIDIAGPFPYSRDNSFVLICVDPFTRWVEDQMKDQTTSSVLLLVITFNTLAVPLRFTVMPAANLHLTHSKNIANFWASITVLVVFVILPQMV